MEERSGNAIELIYITDGDGRGKGKCSAVTFGKYVVYAAVKYIFETAR